MALEVQSQRESVRSISFQGHHRIAYQDWGNSDSEDAIFCLHGLTRNSHDYDVIASYMANNQRRVICPDLVGRGRSDWLANAMGYNLAQYNFDFTVLAGKLCYEKFDIIGTSLGGLIGISIAAAKQSPVRRLVINDVAPQIPVGAVRRLSKYIGTDPQFNDMQQAEAYLRKTLAPVAPMTDGDWRRMTANSVREFRGCYKLAYDPAIAGYPIGRYLGQFLLPQLNLWHQWGRIKCPVLILRGADSDFLTKPLLKKMISRLPHADVIEFKGVGHTPSLNAPQQIEPVLDWLSRN